ncbi:LysM peptidoglycan-binding domain-containing protein [Candidatus Enterococcus ikei]|uniref:LysM peptidoglycan-binding domain-containing protein n=1 Tax=Candidatus Enterococcus ikei TaxID=2815326 RepID=A0ABS3GXF7_9ENTE|nr:LysM peptidoglycan-binding domain-containing protein [Enterococcus sp. DIV0869a]MBO0439947.1 LysM peptidoglycan-binding domain-containing protein [Enterococcus sp. DIV0869a]
MKNRINKKYPILLIFSTILFSTAIYFMSGSLVLGASAGGSWTPETAGDGVSIPAPVDGAQSQTTDNATATAESKQNEEPKEVYVVKGGQTLWEIAQDSGVSVQTLMNKNQLGNSFIIEGQELVLDK